VARVITIDGPSGSGKGTVCRLLADELGYDLLDSGALYRIVAFAAIERNVDLQNEDALTELVSQVRIEFVAADDGTTVLLDEQDVSKAIREEHVGMGASQVARFNKVRGALLERQRAFASLRGLVADGRDMGTVVFPDAKNKFFLTASAEERARRRLLQLQAKGDVAVEYDKILSDIRTRDEQDTKRSVAPLKPAEDAILIDSTELSIAEVMAVIMKQLQ
jgi:cytidylate kinase